MFIKIGKDDKNIGFCVKNERVLFYYNHNAKIYPVFMSLENNNIIYKITSEHYYYNLKDFIGEFDDGDLL